MQPGEQTTDEADDNFSMDDLIAQALDEAWEEFRRNPNPTGEPPESWRKFEQAYLRSNL